DAADQDLLPDHRVAVGIEQRRYGAADHGHPAPGRIVARGEHAAGGDRVIVRRDVVRRRPDHVHVDVLVAALHLQVARKLGNDGGDVAGAVGERGIVVYGQANAIAARDAAHAALTGGEAY